MDRKSSFVHREYGRGRTITNTHYKPDADARLDADEAKNLADWLDVVRERLNGHDAISDETQAEVQTYLALAEATLRRASVEVEVSDAILTMFRPN